MHEHVLPNQDVVAPETIVVDIADVVVVVVVVVVVIAPIHVPFVCPF
jgi:hypothetical protein